VNRRYLLGGLVAGALGSAGLALLPAPVAPQAQPNFTDLSAAKRRRQRFPNVALTTMYTTCDGKCPITTGTLAGVQRILGPRVGRDIFMYSISLDPEHDTPRVLKRYARQFGAKPGWLFLTGTPDAVEVLRKRLGFVDSDPVIDKDRAQHIGMVKYGIEPLERWAACPVFVKPETIASALLRIEPKRERATG
jgi:protein SCO1/2